MKGAIVAVSTEAADRGILTAHTMGQGQPRR